MDGGRMGGSGTGVGSNHLREKLFGTLLVCLSGTDEAVASPPRFDLRHHSTLRAGRLARDQKVSSESSCRYY